SARGPVRDAGAAPGAPAAEERALALFKGGLFQASAHDTLTRSRIERRQSPPSLFRAGAPHPLMVGPADGSDLTPRLSGRLEPQANAWTGTHYLTSSASSARTP